MIAWGQGSQRGLGRVFGSCWHSLDGRLFAGSGRVAYFRGAPVSRSLSLLI